MSVVLASASPTRIRLFEQVDIPVAVHPARVDEEAIRAALVAEDASPRDTADALAEFKARRVAERMPEVHVLGADQILALKGEVFGKPGNRAEAAEHLARLAGQTHHLYSAAVLYHGPKPVWRHVGTARMVMRPLTANEIEAYLEVAWPDVEGSVGAYHAEGYGASLFSRIDGDWFSVLGLPLLEVLSALRSHGIVPR